MSVIFVSHAFSSDPARSARSVAVIARTLATSGHTPIAPQIFLPTILDEMTEREVALRICLALVGRADEVRRFGSISAGMRLEIAEARRLDIPIVAGDGAAEKALTGEPPRETTPGR